MKTILRLGLNVMGVFGEVSEGVERVVAGRVAELGDIPGLPPYDRESITYEPSAYALIWGYVRAFFRRRPRDRAA